MFITAKEAKDIMVKGHFEFNKSHLNKLKMYNIPHTERKIINAAFNNESSIVMTNSGNDVSSFLNNEKLRLIENGFAVNILSSSHKETRTKSGELIDRYETYKLEISW